MARKTKKSLDVDSLKHSEAKRTNIPTAELQSVMREEDLSPVQLAYQRRNRDLDPQLIWRGKDEQDWSDLVVQAPPLYIQEKIHPKVLIDDLKRETKERTDHETSETPDLFADFNGLPDREAVTEFYAHQANWTNRMILGDSLQVMASLAEREGLRGKVQCIYLDPPYGIKFNSNFQWSTTTKDVKDGKAEHITREPEMVKAFRDTWRDGIHSYLTYLRDRLVVARDLLNDTGSIFVQIGDENVHRVRALMDEIFGESNFISEIKFRTTSNRTSEYIPTVFDTVLYYAKDKNITKFRKLFHKKGFSDVTEDSYGCIDTSQNTWRRLNKYEKLNPEKLKNNTNLFGLGDLTSSHEYVNDRIKINGKLFSPKRRYWSTSINGLNRLNKSNRICDVNNTIRYKRYFNDSQIYYLDNIWRDIGSGSQTEERNYVVQTISKAIARCMTMVTDPGDLVLDPTCGSGTTAYVAEQWGRRWITIDTSRVALALARSRIMGARYPWYILADSPEGQQKQAELTHTAPSTALTHGDIRQGFVYERVPHITLKSIANNAEIDVIWDKWQPTIEDALGRLNATLRGHPTPFEIPQGGRKGHKLNFAASHEAMQLPSGEEAPLNALLDWEVPLEAPEDWPEAAHKPLQDFWEAQIERQKEIDTSIAAKADHEYLYDRPYTDPSRVRVAGPFTVESLSPHRTLAMDEDDELIDELNAAEGHRDAPSRGDQESDFAEMVLENLKTSGVQQAHRDGRISFTSITGWPGRFVCAEGRYIESGAQDASEEMETDTARERRAGIFIGPEFGTVARSDLVAAAREAAEAGFDVLIACAFNFDAQSADFDQLGRIPVLKARMNVDLHMADDLKNTGKGNLFVIFGEPDIEISELDDDRLQVKINGVDVFKPQTGEIESSGPEGIACWFIDTDYNEESFFVRHAYFLGANDPYKALKNTLKAEVDEDAWDSLHSDTSRPFARPGTGRIAVKVINHLGDEVMKVFAV